MQTIILFNDYTFLLEFNCRLEGSIRDKGKTCVTKSYLSLFRSFFSILLRHKRRPENTIYFQITKILPFKHDTIYQIMTATLIQALSTNFVQCGLSNNDP